MPNNTGDDGRRHVYRAGAPGRRPAPPPVSDSPAQEKPAPPVQPAGQAPRQPKTPAGDENSPRRVAEANRRNTKGRAAKQTSQKGIGAFLQKHKREVAVAGGILLLIVVILLVALIPSCATTNAASLLSSEETTSLVLNDAEYDKDAFALTGDKYVDTILPLTEDAGMEYVEETVFLGDSNTVRMISYSDITGVTLENGIGVEGMGIQSFTSLKCVQFEGNSNMVTMAEAVKILQPKRVVITFGTNNVGGMGLESFIGHYENALDALEEAYEYADIIIGAVFPVDQYCNAPGITMTKVDQYNVALAELADARGHKFLYWSEALKDTNTGFAQSAFTIKDGYHISREGMDAMFQYMRTHSYITEDRRPKPLNAIPKRIAKTVSLITNDGNTNTTLAPSTTSVAATTTEAVVQESATVLYGVWDETNAVSGGGTVNVNGGSWGSYTYDLYVGEYAPAVTAVPSDGYRFAYWSTSVGGLNTGSATIDGFTVKSAGTHTLTAVFQKIEAQPEPEPEPEPTPEPQPEPEPPPEPETPEPPAEG